jgi:hypothetical protein
LAPTQQNNLSSYSALQSNHQLSIFEKIEFSEKVKILDTESLSNLVLFLYENDSRLIEELNDEKIQIRLDLITRDMYDKIKA